MEGLFFIPLVLVLFILSCLFGRSATRANTYLNAIRFYLLGLFAGAVGYAYVVSEQFREAEAAVDVNFLGALRRSTEYRNLFIAYTTFFWGVLLFKFVLERLIAKYFLKDESAT